MPNDTTEPGDAPVQEMEPREVLVATADVPGSGRFVWGWTESGIMLLGLPDRAPGEHVGRLTGRGLVVRSTSAVPSKFHDALEGYLGGEPQALAALPVVQPGTEFQMRVWDALRTIPFGETRTYAAVAQLVARRDALVAVTNACHANQVSIIVPDHRVVSRSGAARRGFQARLLEHEARVRSQPGRAGPA